MLCPNCESENRDGAKFCDECGFPLTGAIAARAAETLIEKGPANEDEDHGVTEALPAVETVEPANGQGESDDEHEAAQNDDDGLPAMNDTEIEVDWPEEYQPTDEDLQSVEGQKNQVEHEEEPSGGDTVETAPDVTAAIAPDLTGLETIDGEFGERVVGSDYAQPQPNWRDGNTMQMPRIEGEEAPRSKDFLASSTTKQNKGKKVVIGAVIAVVVIALAAVFITYQLEIWGGHAVPDVRGMTQADATSVLEENGFSVRSLQVKSDDTEGLVLVMDPTAGSRLGKGDEVAIHVATARMIPNVVGKKEAEAKAMLEEDGYENVSYVREHSDAEEGTVLSISPEVGTQAKSSIAVTVKVAEPYVVPDTSQDGLDAAIAAVQQAGLGYDISYVDTQEYADGSVIGTTPAAGSKVKSDTIVVIEVARARGAQLTQMTRDLISPGSELAVNGTNYIVGSLGSVEYLGNDRVSFTATARPYTYFFGVYVEGETQQISGVVTWTADNQVASIA